MSRSLPWICCLWFIAGCGGGNTSNAPDPDLVYALSAKSEVMALLGDPKEMDVNRDELVRSNLGTLIEDLTSFEASAKDKTLYSGLLKTATELRTIFEAAKFKWTAECAKKYEEIKTQAEKLPVK